MATIFQHGTLELIMAGLYDGTTTLTSILKNGDFGIGTFDQPYQKSSSTIISCTI